MVVVLLRGVWCNLPPVAMVFILEEEKLQSLFLAAGKPALTLVQDLWSVSDLKLGFQAVYGSRHSPGDSIRHSCCHNECPPSTKAGHLLWKLDGNPPALPYIKNLQEEKVWHPQTHVFAYYIHQSYKTVFPWRHQLPNGVHWVEDDVLQKFIPVHCQGTVLINPGNHKQQNTKAVKNLHVYWKMSVINVNISGTSFFSKHFRPNIENS